MTNPVIKPALDFTDSQPTSAIVVTDAMRTAVLDDMKQRLSYGPNDEAAIGAYAALDELVTIANDIFDREFIEEVLQELSDLGQEIDPDAVLNMAGGKA